MKGSGAWAVEKCREAVVLPWPLNGIVPPALACGGIPCFVSFVFAAPFTLSRLGGAFTFEFPVLPFCGGTVPVPDCQAFPFGSPFVGGTIPVGGGIVIGQE